MATLEAPQHSLFANIFRPSIRGAESILQQTQTVKIYPTARDIQFNDIRGPSYFPATTTANASAAVQRNQQTPVVLLKNGYQRSPLGNGEPKGGFLAQVNPVETTAQLTKAALKNSGIDQLYQSGEIYTEQMTHRHAITMAGGFKEQPGMQISHQLFEKARHSDHGLPSADENVMCSGGGRAFIDTYNAMQTQQKQVGIVTAFEMASLSSHAIVHSRRDAGFPDADVHIQFSDPLNLQAGGQVTLNERHNDKRTVDFTIIEKNGVPHIKFTDGKKPYEIPLNFDFIELKNEDGYRAYACDLMMWELAANDAKRFSQTYFITQDIVAQFSDESFGGNTTEEKQTAAQQVTAAFITDPSSGMQTIHLDELNKLEQSGVLTAAGKALLIQKPVLTREQLDQQAVKEIIRAVKNMEWTAGEMGEVSSQSGQPVLKQDQALLLYAGMLKSISEHQWEKKLLETVRAAKPLRKGEGEILTMYHCSRVSDGMAGLVMVPLALVEQYPETLSAVESRILYAGDTAIEEAGMTNFGFLKAMDDGLRNAGLVKEDGTPDYMRVHKFEIHEPFTVTLNFLRNALAERGFPPEEFDKRVNIHGSSGRLGHPPALTNLRQIGTLSRSLAPGEIGLAVVGAAGANHIVTLLQAPMREEILAGHKHAAEN